MPNSVSWPDMFRAALILLLLLLVAGCGNTGASAEGTSTSLTTTEIAANPTARADVTPDAVTPDAVTPAADEMSGDAGLGGTPIPAGEDEPAASVVRPVADQPDAIMPASTDVLPSLRATTNILLLGSDRRPDTPNWRTDVIMIVALDLDGGRAGVISIPRDVYLDEIPNHQPNRINVVDYLGEQDDPGGGGPALLADIIEARLGIPIHHYLRFDFDSFREVVDALGGVEIRIDCEFRGYIEDEGGWLVLKPGIQRLAGNQAMIYVRDRELTGGDVERARRQQRLVWAVRNQVLNENLLPRIPALYSALSAAVETDIGLVNALRFARFALDIDPDELHGMVIAPPEMVVMGWRDGMSVFVADWPLIAENVQQLFDGPSFAAADDAAECAP